MTYYYFYSYSELLFFAIFLFKISLSFYSLYYFYSYLELLSLLIFLFKISLRFYNFYEFSFSSELFVFSISLFKSSLSFYNLYSLFSLYSPIFLLKFSFFKLAYYFLFSLI